MFFKMRVKFSSRDQTPKAVACPHFPLLLFLRFKSDIIFSFTMAFENEIMDYTEIVNIRETATPSKFN